MLKDFFTLNNTPLKFDSFEDFKTFCESHDTIRNYIYYPDNIVNHKIRHKTFNNISFSKTTIENVEFLNCHFVDCLFLRTFFKNCKFIECSFSGCNTYSLKLQNTYINPLFFDNNFKNYDYSYSNIVVHLYQEIYNNSIDLQLIDFAKKAKYNLLKWEGRLLISKYYHKQPYKIASCQFYLHYIPDIIFRKVFGYGLRLRNFLLTFIITYFCCFFLNKIFWQAYELKAKDIPIKSFDPQLYNNKANFFYTTDVLTKVVDSQFQPTSDIGMLMLTLQGIGGFVLFSFLITVLINKFIK